MALLRAIRSLYFDSPRRIRPKPLAFTTRVPNEPQKTRNVNDKQDKQDKQEPEIPKVSFDDLGISRNVRITLYTLLGIWGTFETYFYYRAVMQWWKSSENSDDH